MREPMISLMPLLIGSMLLFVTIIGILSIFKQFYHHVKNGTALIVNGLDKKVVHFNGALVLPIVHQKEVMSMTTVSIDVDKQGQDGLICQDGVAVDIQAVFYVRVNATEADVLTVAQTLGVANASNQTKVNELFNRRFVSALKSVAKKMPSQQLQSNIDQFRQQVTAEIGSELNGYVLVDVVIDCC